MSEEPIEEPVSAEDDNEPIYYKPKALSLISTIATWLSWVVLVIFIFVAVAQLKYIMGVGEQSQKTLIEMLTDAQQGEQVRLFLYSNLLVPLFSGLTFFVLLQAANIGLNSLMEIDFNIREAHK